MQCIHCTVGAVRYSVLTLEPVLPFPPTALCPWAPPALKYGAHPSSAGNKYGKMGPAAGETGEGFFLFKSLTH